MRLVVAAGAYLTVIVSLSIVSAQESSGTKTSVWDGVYTKQQADRGHSLYSNNCAQCHGPELGGVDETPALAGGQFMSNWSSLTVGALFDRIHNTMPLGSPGQLSPEVDADILAYILSVNGFPDGKTELAHESVKLAQITLDATKPDAK
jgi:S-disulfanyl-L-cysteine oxidoreductase SoxD